MSYTSHGNNNKECLSWSALTSPLQDEGFFQVFSWWQSLRYSLSYLISKPLRLSPSYFPIGFVIRWAPSKQLSPPSVIFSLCYLYFPPCYIAPIIYHVLHKLKNYRVYGRISFRYSIPSLLNCTTKNDFNGWLLWILLWIYLINW